MTSRVQPYVVYGDYYANSEMIERDSEGTSVAEVHYREASTEEQKTRARRAPRVAGSEMTDY